MALQPEDKKDIKKHMGKALANKVSKVTNDSYMKRWSENKTNKPQSASMKKWLAQDKRAAKPKPFIDRLEAHKANHPDAGGKPRKGESYIDYLERYKREDRDFN
jgi:hypothetical protein